MRINRRSDESHSRRSGFTIVELLIVIVVIAILAAISIVAYNGIQARANKSAIASYATSGLKAIQAYKAGEGNYPTSSGCIGSGYIDRTGNSTTDCRWTTSGDGFVASTSVDSQLNKYSNIKDITVPGQVIVSGTQSAIGGHIAVGSAAVLDGVSHTTWFVYSVPDRDCPVGPIAKMTSWPNLVTDSTAKYSEAWGSGALCWIPLR